MVLDGLNNYSSLLQHKKRKFLSNFGKTNFVPGPFSANLFDGGAVSSSSIDGGTILDA